MTPNNYNGLLNTNSAMQGLLLPEPAKPSFGLNYAANILANPSGGTGRSFLQSLLTPLVGATQMYSQQLVNNRKMRADNAASLLDFQKTQLEIEKQKQALDQEKLFNERINQLFGSNPAAMLAASRNDITGAVKLMGGGAPKPLTTAEIITLKNNYTDESVAAFVADGNRYPSLLKQKEPTAIERAEEEEAKQTLAEIEAAPQKEKDLKITKANAAMTKAQITLELIADVEKYIKVGVADSAFGSSNRDRLAQTLFNPQLHVSASNALSGLQSAIAFDALNDLRKSSPTGATGLGSLSEKELGLLVNNLGQLSANSEDEAIQNTVNRLKRVMLRTIEDSQKTLNELKI